MLRERIKHLEAVIFTHEHKDHTAGLDDVRAFNFRQKRDMPIYAHQRVISQLKQEFSYAFADFKYPGVPLLEVNLIDAGPQVIEGISLEAIEIMHYKLPVLGFRYQKFAYLTDVNHIPGPSFKALEGVETLVISALQQQAHISHFTLEEAIAVAKQIGAKRTYLTHISHRMGTHAQVSQLLPKGIELAYDGLRITL
jgi:phosphoribosyl 1,2-cyclic phosphate phosphodiesterase